MHSWVTRICTHGYIEVTKGNPDLYKYDTMDDSDSQVKYPHMHKYPPQIRVNQVLTGTYGYSQVPTSKRPYCIQPSRKNIIYQVIITSSPSEVKTTVLFPFGRLLLSRKTVIISSHGTAPGKSHHDLSTEAAHVLSSESEWHIFDTVSPPQEKALSTSVDVAKQNNS